LRDKESGQTLVEYALIIALVSLAAIVALGFLSGRINNLFSRAGNSLNTVTTP
jgi:Flp pilus assembly pilin Flp